MDTDRLEGLAERSDIGAGLLALADNLQKDGLSRREANARIREWGEQAIETLRECKDGLALLHFIMLGKIAEQAMQGFEDSKRERVRRTTTYGADTKTVAVTRERSDGNPKWLEVAMLALKNQREVVGMNIPPESMDVNGEITADDLIGATEDVADGDQASDVAG